MFRSPALLLPLLAASLLGGCGSQPTATEVAPSDPAVAAALQDEIMTDPDLVRQNPANAALSGGGPASAPIPPELRSPEAIVAARAEAARLAGGTLRHAPQPSPGTAAPAGETAALTAERAFAGGRDGQGCVAHIDYGFGWATKMPAEVPIYPRGHVQEAAGTDEGGCRLRVVNFLTPVAPADVLDFYWTRTAAAGFSPDHRLSGRDHVLTGNKGQGAFALHLRERRGLTEVDLVTNGL